MGFDCFGVGASSTAWPRAIAFVDNLNYGVSIGHNDTDNVMRKNEIIRSGKVGILFRDESRGADFWANRNRIEENVLENSGGPSGIAIDIQGKTKEVQLVRNVIRESRARRHPHQRRCQMHQAGREPH